MEQVVIRAMQPEDVEAVIKIYSEVFDGTYVGFGELGAGMGSAPGISCEAAPDLFQEELNDLLKDSSSNGLFIASFEQNVVGFAVAVLKANEVGMECWLNDLGVSPSFQGKGAGRKLVDRVFAWAFQEKGAKYCLLESGVKNETAHQLFERMGFHPISTVFWKGADS